MKCHHFCNEPLRCPECIRRFWVWVHQHTNGKASRRKRKDGTMKVETARSFYEHAAKSYDDIHGGLPPGGGAGL